MDHFKQSIMIVSSAVQQTRTLTVAIVNIDAVTLNIKCESRYFGIGLR